MSDPRNYTLSAVLAEGLAVAADAERLFGPLNVEQLNWKPAPERWSIAQCLEHLIIANEAFYPQFDAIARGEKRPTLLERLPALPRFWGRFLIKVLLPASTTRVKAPSNTRPSASSIDPEIVSKYVRHMQELAGKMKSLENKNPADVIVTSPFAPFMTYSALDACRIGVVHARRHLGQAERVMATPGFPA